MKILVCKHVPQEGIGYFEELFTQMGVEYEYQELYIDLNPRSLSNYQGLVVMGGPMNVDQTREYPFLKVDYLYIEEALKLGLPMLGFCLGAQLLAKVLGANVSKNSQPELGWYDLDLLSGNDKIFNGFPNRFRVFQWHEDTFEIPPGAKLLASSNSCKNQAFSWKDNVFGLQFHLEVTAPMIYQWLQDTTTLTGWGFEPDEVKQDTNRNITEATKLGSILGQNFVRLI